ncbi:glycosyltransferase [Bifidobacterium panos]|nr:glycosyltransferase [Bifidobacterium sp. DSM 109963]
MSEMARGFCVLMSVYRGDALAHLERAVRSATVEQSVPPNQLVIVRDGPVAADVQAFLDGLEGAVAGWFAAQSREAGSAPTVSVVPLERNQGLAHALNVGLAHCEYELVARADADDISLPSRFATMLPLFDGAGEVGVAGSAIQEFSGDEGNESSRGQVRVLPAGGCELAKYARMQSPLHHPSVMLRKSVVLAAGGYPEHAGRFEDYLLWERLMLRGVTFANVSEVLVLYRVDAGAYERRGGREMFREELRLQRWFLRDGFVSVPQFVRNVAVRACYRLIPTGVRREMYRMLVKLRNSEQAK